MNARTTVMNRTRSSVQQTVCKLPDVFGKHERRGSRTSCRHKYSKGRNHGQVNDPNETEKDHRFQGLGICPKQLHLKVKEQNI